jgi:hypothetical protein
MLSIDSDKEQERDQDAEDKMLSTLPKYLHVHFREHRKNHHHVHHQTNKKNEHSPPFHSSSFPTVAPINTDGQTSQQVTESANKHRSPRHVVPKHKHGHIATAVSIPVVAPINTASPKLSIGMNKDREELEVGKSKQTSPGHIAVNRSSKPVPHRLKRQHNEKVLFEDIQSSGSSGFEDDRRSSASLLEMPSIGESGTDSGADEIVMDRRALMLNAHGPSAKGLFLHRDELSMSGEEGGESSDQSESSVHLKESREVSMQRAREMLSIDSDIEDDSGAINNQPTKFIRNKVLHSKHPS